MNSLSRVIFGDTINPGYEDLIIMGEVAKHEYICIVQKDNRTYDVIEVNDLRIIDKLP